MTATLLTPEKKAEEVREVVKDVTAMLNLRVRRPDVTAARTVAIGEVRAALESIAEAYGSGMPLQTELEGLLRR